MFTSSSCCGCCANNAWRLPKEIPPLVAEHKSKGQFITLQDGTNIFVRDESPTSHTSNTSNLSAVVMVHGVPASSFLYRKFFAPLVQQGYRAIAMDLPGLGLSDKPLQRDYSWKSLAETLGEILDHPELQLFPTDHESGNNNHHKIHLVIHDIGGPIAALWASQHSDRVASITVLDTPLDLVHFRKPFPMNMFPLPLVGSIALATMTPWIFRHFMYLRGVRDATACDHDESVAWVWLLNHNHGGASFAKIMKSFPKTSPEKTALTHSIQQSLGNNNRTGNHEDNERTHQEPRKGKPMPLQIVWAKGEVAIPETQCQYIQDHFQVHHVHRVPGRHFFQLESAPLIVDKIHDFLQAQAQAQGNDNNEGKDETD